MSRAMPAPALPPMPTRSDVCRWCRRRLVDLALLDATPIWYCPSGCAPADAAPRHETCEDCGRNFVTGHRWTRECWECESAALAIERATDPPETERLGYREFLLDSLRDDRATGNL